MQRGSTVPGTVASPERNQSLGEEISNSVTHGVGVALSVAALVLLVVFASIKGDAWRVVGLSIYGSTLVTLYLVSTLYHGFRRPRVKRVFEVLDYSAIYLLIAGTYTPITLVSMRGPWGWTLFGLVWGMAVCGIVSNLVLKGRWRRLSVVFYLAMGWLIVIAFQPMLRMVPAGLVLWLVLGGLCYSLGIVFYAMKRLPYHHTVWHLFVLAGSVCHFFGMLLYVVSAG